MNDNLKTILAEVQDIKSRVDSICSELEKLQENKTDSSIDFKKIRKTAKPKAMANLALLNYDDYSKDIYYTAIMYSVRDTATDLDKKLTMLQRLINGTNYSASLEELMQRSYLVNDETIDELIKICRLNHLEEYFLLDCLIVNGVGDSIDPACLKFISSIAAFLGLSKEKVRSISMFARAVIEQNLNDCIVSLKGSDLDLNLLKSYMPQPIKGYVVNDLYQKHDGYENIYIINQVFNGDDIDISKMVGNEFTFKCCTFKNLLSFKNNNEDKYVRFENCKFVDRSPKSSDKSWFSTSSKDPDRMMQFYNGRIDFYDCEFNDLHYGTMSNDISCLIYYSGSKIIFQNCHFSNCISDGSWFLLYVDNAEMYNISFNNIEISKNNSSSTGIIHAEKSTLKYMNFENCSVYCSNRSYGRYAHIVSVCAEVENSILTDSSFKKCFCDSRRESDGSNGNYIVYSKRSSVKGLKFESCLENKKDIRVDYGYFRYRNLWEEQ